MIEQSWQNAPILSGEKGTLFQKKQTPSVCEGRISQPCREGHMGGLRNHKVLVRDLVLGSVELDLDGG